uniref:[histone H3]-dimethyl-L-lysine(36) demethylase n=1 Tax=Echeneis naucrates TaxID=173247 RepID=A0A665XES6_ECHNA
MTLAKNIFCYQRTGTRRRYQDDGISDDEIEGKRMFDLDEKLQCDRFGSDLIKHMEGKDFTFEYIQREGLRDPIIFKTADGLGIQMPDPDFSVSDVKLFVGSRRIVDVMDVNTQKGIEMSMAQWRRYYETPPSEREKLYNVISLEFSHTRLENLVKRPASVDVIDWVDNMWPRHLKERQRDSTNAIIDMHYPKVQKYCLMSVQGCFTDFHIDFGGTSVWYHILRGGKVFWLIPPTPQNLEMYENWVLSGKQGDIFLGDKCHDCQRIELKQGYTFIIPSGWIHAVYTPEDTLVFGGNFLHSFNIPMQLNIYSIEDRTRVPAKFRYPFYYEMCWYVLERYLYCLTNISHLTPEFQKYSLGIGEDRLTQENILVTFFFFVCTDLNCLTRADLETNDDTGNGTSNGAHCDTETAEAAIKEEEIKEEAAAQVTAPQHVLTPFELEGLWNLLGKLEELPAHKKCVPAGIRNAAALLEDMRAVLNEHANDNPKMAYTGEPIVKWPKRPLGQRPTKRSSISALRRRRVRCKRCDACCRKECGNCQYCQDMRKFGGPGRMKKSCIMRQCLAPALPNTARCAICGEGESEESNPSTHSLMECSICSQIAHRQCIKVIYLKHDLPSCWECPKCYQGKDSASEVTSHFLLLTLLLFSTYFLSPPFIQAHVFLFSAKIAQYPPLISSPGLVFERKGEPHKGRGRGVRLRGGGAGSGIRNGRSHGDMEEESEDSSSSSSSSSSSDEEEERGQSTGRGGDKENQPQSRHGGRVSKDVEEEGALVRPPIRNRTPCPDQPSSRQTHTGHTDTRPSHSDVSKRLRPSRPAKLSNGASCSSSSELPHLRIPLSALQEGGSEADRESNGSGPGCEREVWVSVFRYLSRSDLCCVFVCRCLDKRLWSRIDLSVKRTITPQALTGIIKRQPVTLDLSWTNISKKQLNWLVGRLPGLKDLMLAGCSWSSISALCSSGCPLIRSLDLRYADGVKDSQIRDLVSPPGCDNRSQLRAMQCLRLAGLDISDSTLRLVIRHMPHLTKLDLSHCNNLTDHSINLLTAVGSSTRNTLTELNLGGCSKLTDTCLKYLRRLSCISLLDLRGCKGVSRKACEDFISELSVNTLYCLSDEKLIQRIS